MHVKRRHVRAKNRKGDHEMWQILTNFLARKLNSSGANNSGEEGEKKGKQKNPNKKPRFFFTEERIRGMLGMIAMFFRIIGKSFRYRSSYIEDFCFALFECGGLREALRDEYGRYRTAVGGAAGTLVCGTCFWLGALVWKFWQNGILGIGYMVLFLVLHIRFFWQIYGETNLHVAIRQADVRASHYNWS